MKHLLKRISLREKCPYSKFLLFRVFSHSAWIRRDMGYLSIFNSNAGKCRPEKSPNTDTFHAVIYQREGHDQTEAVLYPWTPVKWVRMSHVHTGFLIYIEIELEKFINRSIGLWKSLMNALAFIWTSYFLNVNWKII